MCAIRISRPDTVRVFKNRYSPSILGKKLGSLLQPYGIEPLAVIHSGHVFIVNEFNSFTLRRLRGIEDALPIAIVCIIGIIVNAII